MSSAIDGVMKLERVRGECGNAARLPTANQMSE